MLLLPIVLVAVSAAQSTTNFSAGPQYLLAFPESTFLQPIATPSLDLNTPLPPIPSLPQVGPSVSSQPYVSNPALQNQANLLPVYYGYPTIVDVELASTELPRELPSSINDTGFVNVPSAQSLREFGYGVTMGEAASFWKAHKPTGTRVYTNADIERLRSSS